MSISVQQIRLARRPMGEPTPSNFEPTVAELGDPLEGQVLRRTIYLSLDPYMRGRMNSGRSYVDPVEVGHVMCGGTVSQVIDSRNPGFTHGDYVLGYDGWQTHAVSDGRDLRKVDSSFKLSYYLGVLGMPGLTAYVGMLDIGKPQPGETVVVSAACGAVGTVAGQIARLRGCRVIGTTGSDAKCEYCTKELGFDACVNYRSEPLLRGLKRACPDGIDIYFDNVGGDVLATVLRLINVGARIPLIGMISQYNATEMVPGPNLMPILVKRAMLRGMIVHDHADREDAFRTDMAAWLRQGQIKYPETVEQGLQNAPEAFMGLFRGDNVGKLLVQVSNE